MSQTHRIDVGGDVVTKTYVDWSRGEHLREWAALRVISAAAPDLVPVPVSFAPQAQPSITMGWLPGSPLTGSLSAAQLEGLQVALAELWSIPSSSLEPFGYGAFVERIRRGISSWSGSGVVAQAHQAAEQWLAGSAVAELEEPLDVVIGHGDPNLANYLWDGQRVRIVDFEDAGRSDLAFELANLVEHIASRDTEWTGFLEGFQVEPARLRAARCLWAAFWLTLLRPGEVAAHRNPAGTAELQAERVLGLLEASRTGSDRFSS